MTERCRLCTANDRDGLVSELAERMWEMRRDREIDPSWADAGGYWRRIMLEFAGEAIRLLSEPAEAVRRVA